MIGFNEMMAGNGEIRTHWQGLVNGLAAQTPQQLHRQQAAIQREIHDNGLTYNVYTDAQGVQRPWALDALPFILSNEEWQPIAAAVAQRAFLLNKILLDIYGEQNLLAQGLLPPDLIFGHTGFLHACHGSDYADGIALHLYAADLARAPDGRWWVLGDRTQAPTGAGYALENRTIISGVYPDLFKQLNVERLSGFFTTLRESLDHWGRLCAARQCVLNTGIEPLPGWEQPLIVILTPGPYNETYHGQSYLSRYLGYPLVQGDDLVMREGMIWLKTIFGLKPVHAILRRQDDDFCDPLELNEQSLLGVPGLNEAARRGTVLVANALGSNILQSGALLGYLPNLCRQMLGEELRLPSAATWWCGEAAALDDVAQRLDKLIIKPAFPQNYAYPIFGSDLDTDQRAALMEKIRAQPQQYIAQEPITLSRAPSSRHLDTRLPPAQWPDAAVGLRVYACATPNGYAILPGGLTRVAGEQDERILTMQRGGISKDTWVISPNAPPHESLLHTHTRASDLVRENQLITSRLAEDYFWLGRAAMRSLSMTRLLRSAMQYFIYNPPAERQSGWPALQNLAFWYNLMPSFDPQTAADDTAISRQLNQAVFSREHDSLLQQVRTQHELAARLRERLSDDHWRAVHRLAQHLETVVNADAPAPVDTLDYLNEAHSALSTITGFILEGMTRTPAWHFMQIGRHIERIQYLAALLQQCLYLPPESNLDWVLELTDNIVTYRSRYGAQPEYLPLLDLLLLDGQNPNAMLYSLHSIRESLAAVSHQLGGSLEQTFDALTTRLLTFDIDSTFCPHSMALSGWLNDIHIVGSQLSELLTERFFTHSGGVARSLSPSLHF